MRRSLKKVGILAVLAFCALGGIISVVSRAFDASAATGASYGIGGASTVYVGEAITLTFSVDTGGNTVKTLGATINEVAGCLTLESISGIAPASANIYSKRISLPQAITSATSLATATYRAGGSECTAVITMGGAAGNTLTYGDNTVESPSTSKTINVIAPTPEPEKSSDNQITGLTSDKGTVTGDGTNYTVSGVPAGTSSISLTPALPAGASVQGGSPVNCNLSGDTSTCSFTVVAEDGTPKTYTVTVNREPEKKEDEPTTTDPSLKEIAADNNVISGFKPDVTSYTISVGADVTSMNFTAIANDPETTYTVAGASGWKTGTNVVSIIATAKDGTKRVYTINVIRAKANTDRKDDEEVKKSSNNYLEKLVSHDGALNPDFDKNKTTYTVRVPRDVTKLNLTAVPEDGKAKVEIEGNNNFEIGKTNTVLVKVTAENGEQRIYTINVTREDVEAKTDLNTLEVVGYDISPKYDKDVDKYTVTVPYDVDKVDVIALAADKDSTVTIIGNDNLAVGNNTILVKVTDKNGFTHVYEINVRRKEEPTLLGIRRSVWKIILIIVGILLFLFLLFLLLWLLFFRRRREREEYAPAPTIEFNPAFNFGSRVGTDDDTVMPYGVNNQAETIPATNLQTPQRQAIAANSDERETRYIEQPTTTASVTPAAVAAASTATPASLAAMAADNSMDEMEKRAEERAEMRAMRREVERLELERDQLRNEAIEAETAQKAREEAFDEVADDTVTKEELMDALEDIKNNHDSSKLKLLMKQEELNRQKEELRRAEAKQAERETASAMKDAQSEFWD